VQARPETDFPCSGAADVGEIADRAARRLAKEGAARCIVWRVSAPAVNDIMVNAQAASMILAIDGCKQDCGAQDARGRGLLKFQASAPRGRRFPERFVAGHGRPD